MATDKPAGPTNPVISIVGGTGALGGGLARRWAQAGLSVVIGSRSADKAAAASADLRAKFAGANVQGLGNLEAALAGTVVVLTVPFAQQRATLESIRPALAGKILVDTTVPLVPPKVARVQLPKEGAAALITQQLVGDGVSVVAAFHNVSADSLHTDEALDCDVLVVGNQVESREVVVGLARAAGLRAWHAGPLENAAAAEALTSVLIFMNKRYGGIHTGLRITGIPDDAA
ncbi:MAG: NADPH-dependent F420 reductase [Gammaproteobacteria bacterium]